MKTASTRNLIIAALACALGGIAALSGSPAQATEGGASAYLQGTYNDFAVAIAGPPGFYLRNDVARYDANNFRADGVGLGPAVLYTSNIVGKDVNFIAKWIHDVAATNRFKGDLIMLSFALKLFQSPLRSLALADCHSS